MSSDEESGGSGSDVAGGGPPVARAVAGSYAVPITLAPLVAHGAVASRVPPRGGRDGGSGGLGGARPRLPLGRPQWGRLALRPGYRVPWTGCLVRGGG